MTHFDAAIVGAGAAGLHCAAIAGQLGRKVVLLVKRGYVYRSEDGYLYLTTTVGDDFEDMNATLIENLLATARRLESLLANRPTPLGPLRAE